MSTETKRGFTTQILHGDRQSTIEHGSNCKPIHTAIAYGYKDAREIAEVFQGTKPGYSYGRQNNPTTTALENKITTMEQGTGSIAFSTGMAAISAVMMTLLRQGDHLIASRFIFGNTNSFLNTLMNFGIEVSFVDATDSTQIAAAVQPNTKMVFVETIANPCTQIADLKNIGQLCQEKQLVFVVDNTMTSPYLFKPIKVGASLSINSLSKCIAGHGDVLGGAVTELGQFDWSRYDNIIDTYKKGDSRNWALTQIKKKGLRDTGATLDSMAAHHIAIGAETLSLRMSKISDNALKLAQFLSQQDKIVKVFYPGLPEHPEHERAAELFMAYGGLISINLDPAIDCFEFLNQLQVPIISSHLGDNRTLIIPVAHTIFYEMGPERRASMGIDDNTIRISVGIEDIEDLINDFDRTLNG
ncbi:cystathionine gamma-synthase family protein [Gynuella sp.]|uniref:cystathionine gamma-synthase family protein n=1 Tax=Gynuella sp. TaxID=2969146 RepID=UPI003D0D252E